MAIVSYATAKEPLFGSLPWNTGLLTKVNPQRFRKLVIKQSGLGLTITKGEDLLVFLISCRTTLISRTSDGLPIF
jgi:hypothetical protein